MVFQGNLSKNWLFLQPGDIITNGHHVGIYAPAVLTNGGNTASFAVNEATDVGNGRGIAAGNTQVYPGMISAATPNERNFWSSDSLRPQFGGVTWNNWGFRGDANDSNVVARRLVR